MLLTTGTSHRAPIVTKLAEVPWGLVALVAGLAVAGLVALWAAAGGSPDPWAARQAARFTLFSPVMLAVALIPLRFWYAVAWPAYFAGLALLTAVEVMGHIGMGAQRWIDLGFMRLQPSELMKIALVLALARYFHAMPVETARSALALLPALSAIAAPVALVLLQPDLGTAVMLTAAGAAVIFLAGAPVRLFVGGALAVAGAVPVAWHFLHDYQRARVLTFLDPSRDPLGAGYHITQSKIAIGSGGLWGKGVGQGTQAQLHFLPEQQTDFIFALWAEEWGFVGATTLLVLLALIMAYGLWIALACRTGGQGFARLLALGLSVNFSLYVFVNIAMVTGLIPVVGAPLPLMSYGGSAMLAAVGGFGLMMSAYIHRDQRIRGL
jgi:rod shape determining protein RodA